MYCLGQDNSVKSKHYMSKHLLSPAYTGISNSFNATLIQRNQWIGIKNAPYLSILDLDIGFKDHYGFGIFLSNFKNGNHQNGLINLSFAYHISLSPEYELNKSRLSFGLSYTGNIFSLDERNFSSPVYDQAVNGNIESSYSTNFNFGVRYNYKKFTLGLSILNIINEKSNIYNSNIEKPLPRYYVFEIENTFKYSVYEFKPFLISTLNSYNEYYMDSGLKLTVNSYDKRKYNFMIMNKAAYVNNNFTNTSIVGLIGYSIKNYTISYVFEKGISGLNSYHYGSHEIMFRYSIPVKYECYCDY